VPRKETAQMKSTNTVTIARGAGEVFAFLARFDMRRC
jgi:hypothetical protein